MRRFWLAHVLEKPPDYPASKVDELLPWNWKARTAAQAQFAALAA